MSHWRRRSSFRVVGHAATWLAVGTGLGMAVILLAPRNLGLGFIYPVVQLEALRLGWIIVLFFLTGMVAVLVRHNKHTKGVRRQSLQLMALLLAGVALTEFVLFAGAGGFLSADRATVPADGADITVLSFNARDSEAADVVQAAVAVDADVLLLVEVDSGVALRIAELLSRHGMTNQLFTDSKARTPDPDATAIITSGRLGNYQQVASPALVFGAVSVDPVDSFRSGGGGLSSAPPKLSSVHPPPPLPGKYSPTVWERQLRLSVQVCRAGEGTIVGGDFNASTAHIALVKDEGCVDAGLHLERGAVGTWPRLAPAPFGASIDHQVADRSRWEPAGIRFLDIGASDHRALAVSYRAVEP